MRWFMLVLPLLIVASAGAHDLGNLAPEKSPRPWPANVPADARQGGDTIDDALPIDTVPYQTTGTTTGYANDYDEACPYDGSVAPDVAYAFTPPDVMQVDIDMLGSAYDTKIYLYDQNLILVACNDDYYADYVSKLERVELDGGVTYYLVIDGYGEEHGDYTLAIEQHFPCDIQPAFCDQLEDEPPLHDGYQDASNGGCNSPEWGSPIDYLHDGVFCGRSGWYTSAGGDQSRDTDWYYLELGADGTAAITIDAEAATYLFELSPQDCDQVAVVQTVAAGPCSPATMHIIGEPNSSTWVWVGPQTFVPPSGFPGQEYDYVLMIEGVSMPSMAIGSTDDYTFGAPHLAHPAMSLTFDAGPTSHDDADLAELCAGTPTPGPDLLATVYLAAGDQISGEFYPFYIAADGVPSPQRMQPLCLAVVSDLRDPDGTCLGAGCSGNYNTWFTVSSPTESGWYYLVADRQVTEPLNHAWAYLWHSATPPPPAPAGDTCADAAVIPPGPIAIAADLTDATNAADPGRDGCLDAPTLHYTGRDLIYRVDFFRGQALDVTMRGEGGWDEALYLVRDCESPMGNCVASAQPTDDGVRLRYTALADETLWLVCDSWGLGPRPFTLTGSLDDVTAAPSATPEQLSLRAAPTPFNPTTTITYDLPRAGHTRLRVHDLRGRLVATLVDRQQEAGTHSASWHAVKSHGGTLPSGAYVLRLEVGQEVRTARVTVIK